MIMNEVKLYSIRPKLTPEIDSIKNNNYNARNPVHRAAITEANKRALQPLYNFLGTLPSIHPDYKMLPKTFSISALLTTEQVALIQKRPDIEEIAEDFTDDDFE